MTREEKIDKLMDTLKELRECEVRHERLRAEAERLAGQLDPLPDLARFVQGLGNQ